MAENTALFGKWDSYKSENIQAVMEKAGAPWLAQKMSDKTNPTMTIERLDDKRLKMSTKVMLNSIDQELTLGSVCRFKPPHGNEQDCLAEWEAGKLVIYIGPPGTDPKAGNAKQIREILDNGEMLMTMQAGDVIGKRWFKKH